jgi:hypothetical protein
MFETFLCTPPDPKLSDRVQEPSSDDEVQPAHCKKQAALLSDSPLPLLSKKKKVEVTADDDLIKK